MEDGSPGLEVGFKIDTGGSLTELERLRAMMNSSEATALKAAAEVERAFGGIKLGGATAQITAYGSAATREMQSVARETGRVEKAGERLIGNLQRQSAEFGKTASEIRNLKVDKLVDDLTRLGNTDAAERMRAVNAELNRLESGVGRTGKAGRLATHDLLNLGYQLNDIVVSLIGGQKPLTVFAQQGAQIGQIAASSGVGLRGMAASVAALALPFAPLIAVVAVAAGGLALFNRSVSSGVDTTAMVNSLGLTRAEIKRLENTTVTTGDVVKGTFQVMAERVGLDLGGMKGFFGDAMDFMTKVGRSALAGLYAGFVGTFDAIGIIVRNLRNGKFGDILGDVDKQMTKRFDEANGAMKRFGADVTKQAASNKLADLTKQAREIKLDRPAKTDKHAEQLAREAAATEAQIRNLYRLADAYGVSGAAALIAEARVKAETAAIKKRADIEELVNRQIRLAIAQRVADTEKSSAATREAARIQTEVNAEVALSNVPAERAAQLMQERIAELPLLAAIEAAQQRGLRTEAERATQALDAQRSASAAARAAATGAFFVGADAMADKRLADLGEELRLVGATNDQRIRGMAASRAAREIEAAGQALGTAYADTYIAKQVQIAVGTERVAQAQDAYNDSLTFTADKWDIIAGKVQSAATGMADAFGSAGRAIGGMASIYAGFNADRERAQAEHDAQIRKAGGNEAQIARENARFALRSSGAQIQAYGDMASAAKGFFKDGSGGYKALAAAEKAYRVVQFAMSVQAMVQNAAETLGVVTGAAAKSAAEGSVGIAKQSQLPFPLNIAAMAATGAALLAAGIAVIGGGGGGTASLPKTNTGTGSVLGDADAKSESLKRSIDQLHEVDTLMLSSSREMAQHLRSIDSQIGSFASVLVRSGKTNANDLVTEKSASGILGKLFGSSTKIVGGGLSAGPQSLASILGSGFDAQVFTDVEKTKKFLGITTSKKVSTTYAGADPAFENQITGILREFNAAIAAAAGPLGASTDEIQQRLNGFVVDLGRIDLKGLTGSEIEEKLTAVFGKAADDMASAAFPGFEQFQKVGEGLFETVVRVASTVETVTASLTQLGSAAAGLGIDAKVGLADQFDSLSDFTSAIGGYFEAFYTPAEQNAAKLSQITSALVSMNVTVPETLAGFRSLVEAQDLNTDAGRQAYATLIQLAPAFAELKSTMDGAKSAADVLNERQDIERKLLEMNGDTAAIRALELAKLDESNRALQQQVYALQDQATAAANAEAAAKALADAENATAQQRAGLTRQLLQLQGDTAAIRAIELAGLDASNRALQDQIYALTDAQEAAKAAQTLADAWGQVGNSIADEIARIRGLSTGGNADFATLQGQFNAATSSARAGDMEAAKLLPGLSQSLLAAAADAARSRQELERVKALTIASLEATNAAIGIPAAATSNSATLSAAATASQASAAPAATNASMVDELRQLRAEVAAMRQDNNAGHAATAGNTGKLTRIADNVTSRTGGDSVAVEVQAA